MNDEIDFLDFPIMDEESNTKGIICLQHFEQHFGKRKCLSCGISQADPDDSCGCDDMLAHDDELCWRGAGDWAQVARELAAKCTAPHARRCGTGRKRKCSPSAAVR